MKERDYVKISFTGDLMCLKEQNEAVTCHQVPYDEIFVKVKSIFSESDLVIGNLETPISRASLSSESINFNTHKEFAQACKNCGFDFVSTANNHCLDRGIRGLKDTIENLDEIGLSHSGTYATKTESEEIFLTDVAGLKVGIVCATYGTNSEVNGCILPKEDAWMVDLLKKQNKTAKFKFNPDSEMGKKMISDNVSGAAIGNTINIPYVEKYLRKIEIANSIADVVFVVLHIGGQFNPYPGNYTRHIVDITVNQKPSYVISGHPHVPQYMATVKDIPVAFSLGNFSFTPEVGYYIPNCFAEYGVVLHTYWNRLSKKLLKSTFTIIKNIVGDDGISRVYPVTTLFNELDSPIEKERLDIEVQAVANRVASRYVDNPYENEIDLKDLPKH